MSPLLLVSLAVTVSSGGSACRYLCRTGRFALADDGGDWLIFGIPLGCDVGFVLTSHYGLIPLLVAIGVSFRSEVAIRLTIEGIVDG